jgi:prepilin-type N-terminal cleavage/methylation domain-containing protein
MTSPSISNRNNRGFTLIEILIVMAILITLIGLGVFMSMDSYRAYLSRSERDTVVSLLQRTRSRAMANVYQTPWGMCYIVPNYIVFRGTTCTAGAATNETTPGNSSAVLTGLTSVSPVVFSQIAGTTTAATITVTENARVSTIGINYEGTIIW